MSHSVSVVIPCKNEQDTIGKVIDGLLGTYPEFEIIVVNDGSTDNTATVLEQYSDVTVITHNHSLGNGAAIKSGSRAANNDVLLFMDADGQHNVDQISKLLENLNPGYDMVVGSRTSSGQATKTRTIGNIIYNKIASFITNHKVKDLTSGFRAVYRDKFMEFISLLPNGFSYPTTITMAFFRTGYTVKYIDIHVADRVGKSHLSVFKDGIRFFIIIFKVATLYSPLKLIAPISIMIFLSGLGLYAYNYIQYQNFTNMSLLLLLSSVIIFIIGLLSEQVTTITYLLIQNRNNLDS